jgi:hypothetical protein
MVYDVFANGIYSIKILRIIKIKSISLPFFTTPFYIILNGLLTFPLFLKLQFCIILIVLYYYFSGGLYDTRSKK